MTPNGMVYQDRQRALDIAALNQVMDEQFLYVVEEDNGFYWVAVYEIIDGEEVHVGDL